MRKKNKNCSTDERMESDGCKIESVVSVDERGQMVLPKEVRDKLGIGPGDKLAVVIMRKKSKACCATLIRVEELAVLVNDFLSSASSFIASKEAK